MVNGFQNSPVCAVENEVRLLFPLTRVDSSFRRAATGILGSLFQTLLYHLHPVGVPSRRIQDILSINDGGGCGRKFAGDDRRVVGVSSIFISAPLSFQRKLESRKAMTEW